MIAPARSTLTLEIFPGSLYCQNHLVVSRGEKRVPCPVDPSQCVPLFAILSPAGNLTSMTVSLIFERKLESHSQKCLSAKRQKLELRPPWIVDDMNAGSDDESATKPESVQLDSPPMAQADADRAFVPLAAPISRHSLNKPSKISTLDPRQLQVLVDKVHAAYEKVSKELELRQLVDFNTIPHFDLKPHTADPRALTPTGAFNSKHAPQHDSFLAHLRQLNALSQSCIFVEYGAGRGTLSWVISQASGGSDHILIDRGHFRRKAETRVRSAEKDSDALSHNLFMRVQADIKDFDMTKIPQLVAAAGAKKHVAFSKHLCGAATDLTLRCIRGAKALESSAHVAPDVVMIALCCHQKCSWKPFCSTPLDLLVLASLP
jgi:tRNA:m4X modification enzyme